VWSGEEWEQKKLVSWVCSMRMSSFVSQLGSSHEPSAELDLNCAVVVEVFSWETAAVCLLVKPNIEHDRSCGMKGRLCQEEEEGDHAPSADSFFQEWRAERIFRTW